MRKKQITVLFAVMAATILFGITVSGAVRNLPEREVSRAVVTKTKGISLTEQITELDLSYWFKGIDETEYAKKLDDAAHKVPTTGVGYCAAWVSYVYQEAGLGFVGGNACDMWAYLCISNSADDIREGMIIAVRNSPTSELGMKYGHCGVIVKNPDYHGPDVHADIVRTEALLERAVKAQEAKESIKPYPEDLIRMYEERLEVLREEDTDQYFYVNGHLMQADQDGNERWLVADSTSGIGFTKLSSWISKYDTTRTVAWGWGHGYSGRVVVWDGDLPKTVAFVYHEKEAEEEDLEKESVDKEEETTEEEATEEETTEEEAAEEETTEKETTREKETSPKEQETETKPQKPEKPEKPEKPTEKETPVEKPTEAVAPAVTEPEVTEPVYTEPEVTEPVYTEPEVTEPVYTEPEVTEPVYTEPEVTEPVYTEPEITEPVYTEPEVTEPVYTEPEITEPVYTEPEIIEPVYTEPVYEEPVYEEPVYEEPEASYDEEPAYDAGESE